MNEVVGMDEFEVENKPVEDLESEVVNLAAVLIDQSQSMEMYTQQMIQSLTDFRQALLDSKEADEMVLSRVNFYEKTVEASGYIAIENFNCQYQVNGRTPLYDAIVTGSERMLSYMKQLKDNGMRPKAVFGVFGDGLENNSKETFEKAKECLIQLHQNEVVTAFISFGDEAKVEAKRLGFRNVLEVGRSQSELRRAFNVFSKSVIEHSKSVTARANDPFYV